MNALTPRFGYIDFKFDSNQRLCRIKASDDDHGKIRMNGVLVGNFPGLKDAPTDSSGDWVLQAFEIIKNPEETITDLAAITCFKKQEGAKKAIHSFLETRLNAVS